MLGLDLLNITSSDDVKCSCLNSHPLLRSQLKGSEDQILYALLNIWDILRKDLLKPVFLEGSESAWTLSFLHHTLPNPSDLLNESEKGILRLCNSYLHRTLEANIGGYIAREIQFLFDTKAITSVKRCARCKNIFIANPANDICCSILCLSLLSISDQINNPETRKSFFDDLKLSNQFIYYDDFLSNPRFNLN
jgi:hypothetical protein